MEKTVKEYINVERCGYSFRLQVCKGGKLEKFFNDLETVSAILEKGNDITAADRFTLLRVYNIAYHESGKIEGVFSLDSTATNCTFCVKMREAAKNNPDIICGYCYDFEQEKYKRQALNRHTLNMLIMSRVEFSIEELKTLPVYGIVRVNSSGDAANKIYAANMIKFAIAHPDCKIAIWSKNAPACVAACDEYGKPENVTLIQSSVFINRPGKLAKYFDHMFTVYNDAAAVNAAIAGGACECNGKKCRDCGYKCYLNGWEKGANIAELLRK